MLIRENNKGIDWRSSTKSTFHNVPHDRKLAEFEGFKQGNLTVAEYEAKFIELAQFALHMVDTDYKKARKFEGGLCNDI
ncbi:unnamed protein product [Camellia sinensis]